MKKIIGMVVLLAAICVLVFVENPRFVSPENLQNLTRHIALLAIFAIGEGIVIISGGIDLSVGAVIAFGGVFLTVAITEWGVPPFLAGIMVILIGMAIGLWHGFLITKVRLQPFIATLCTMLILRGHSRVMVSEQTMGFGNGFPGVRALGTASCWGFRRRW